MSGENVSTVLELKRAIDEKLAQYRDSHNIKFKYDPITLNKALTLTKTEFEHMDQTELSAYAYTLNSYALYLQLELNSAKTDISWVNHHILILIGKYGSSVGSQYTPYEQRKAMLLVENSHGVELNKLLLEATLRSEQLNMLSAKVNTIANNLTYRGRKYGSE
jgi:hypothetical protein